MFRMALPGVRKSFSPINHTLFLGLRFTIRSAVAPKISLILEQREVRRQRKRY
jgi:hypothetical protein